MEILVWGPFILMLLVIFTVVVLPFFAVKTENSELKLSRLHFLVWTAMTFIVFPFAVFVAFKVNHGFDADTKSLLALTSLICFWVLIFMFYRRVARRTRDAGLKKSVAYLAIIPLAIIIVVLVSLVAPS